MSFRPICGSCFSYLSPDSGLALSCACFLCSHCSADLKERCEVCKFCGTRGVRMTSLEPNSILPEVGALLSSADSKIEEAMAITRFQMHHYKKAFDLLRRTARGHAQNHDKGRQLTLADRANTPHASSLQRPHTAQSLSSLASSTDPPLSRRSHEQQWRAHKKESALTPALMSVAATPTRSNHVPSSLRTESIIHALSAEASGVSRRIDGEVAEGGGGAWTGQDHPPAMKRPQSANSTFSTGSNETDITVHSTLSWRPSRQQRGKRPRPTGSTAEGESRQRVQGTSLLQPQPQSPAPMITPQTRPRTPTHAISARRPMSATGATPLPSMRTIRGFGGETGVVGSGGAHGRLPGVSSSTKSALMKYGPRAATVSYRSPPQDGFK